MDVRSPMFIEGFISMVLHDQSVQVLLSISMTSGLLIRTLGSENNQ
jgi:hypothetical protein